MKSRPERFEAHPRIILSAGHMIRQHKFLPSENSFSTCELIIDIIIAPKTDVVQMVISGRIRLDG